MGNLSEADTCRTFILPKLYAAGWNDDQISEQKSFTDGRIVVAGKKAAQLNGSQDEVILSILAGPFSGNPIFVLYRAR